MLSFSLTFRIRMHLRIPALPSFDRRMNDCVFDSARLESCTEGLLTLSRLDGR
jgi:hypothetical protein